MEKFKTQFLMSGVKTYATVVVLDDNKFGVTLNLIDFFEGEETSREETDFDAIVTIASNGSWHVNHEEKTNKITLSNEDCKNLGEAIEHDYIKH